VVSRNRQRETENKNKCLHDKAIPQYRVRDLASWQDKLYFNVTIPVVEPVPEPPAPKRPRGRPRLYHLKLKRTKQETKREVTKPKTEWQWQDYYKNPLEWRTVKKNYSFFNKPLNYHWGNLWAIRHCELEYEGESEPL
jgi:hypothetical protein